MRCFVDEDLLKEALRLEPIRLAGMDENIVVAAAEELYPPVNPDRLEFRLPKGSRQLANQPAVFVGFLLRSLTRLKLGERVDQPGRVDHRRDAGRQLPNPRSRPALPTPASRRSR